MMRSCSANRSARDVIHYCDTVSCSSLCRNAWSLLRDGQFCQKLRHCGRRDVSIRRISVLSRRFLCAGLPGHEGAMIPWTPRASAVDDLGQRCRRRTAETGPWSGVRAETVVPTWWTGPLLQCFLELTDPYSSKPVIMVQRADKTRDHRSCRHLELSCLGAHTEIDAQPYCRHV